MRLSRPAAGLVCAALLTVTALGQPPYDPPGGPPWGPPSPPPYGSPVDPDPGPPPGPPGLPDPPSPAPPVSEPGPVTPGQTSGGVERWDTHELSFQAVGRYANPFRDVQLRAVFTHSSGLRIPVDGFYDGGSTWRIRFMPMELGRWIYVTQSGDVGLNGKQGSIDCVVPQKPYLRGPVVADGFHFRHADGSRRFLITTRLSSHFSHPGGWPAKVRFLQENGINRVLFMIGGNRGHVANLYGSGGEDLWSYDVERFQSIDNFIDTLRQTDILASPYFYYFNDGEQRRLTPEQDEAFVRYGIARFGAYANVMPVLANEVEQRFTDRSDLQYDLRSHEWANRLGALLKHLSVFGLPVAVHNPMESFEAVQPGFFSLVQDWPFPWADLMLKQLQVGALGTAARLSDDVPEPEEAAWNARAFARHNDVLTRLRRFGVPVINEEPGYELGGERSWDGLTRWTVRATFWTAVTAGAYATWGSPATYEVGSSLEGLQSSATPADLKTLKLIMDQVPYWEMAPQNNVVNPNPTTVDGEEYRRNFALVKPGQYYLVYSLNGGNVQVEVQPGDYQVGSIPFRNPDVPSDQRPTGRVSVPGGRASFSLTPGTDWVVLLRRVD